MGFIGVQPTSAPLTASDITDGIVSNAKLGADSVNATKIADDSISEEHIDNTAITGFSALTSLADTDKFLVSDASDSGNLKYVEKQYLGGGGLVFIQSQSVTSNTSQVNFDSVFSSTYDNYLFIWEITPNTGGVDVHFNFRTTVPANHGSAYYQAVNVKDHLNNDDSYVLNNHSTLILAQGPYDQDDKDKPTSSGYLIIHEPFNSGLRTSLQMQNSYNATNADYRFGSGGCFVDSTAQFGGFSCSTSSGSINNMTGRVYGMVNS